MRSISIIFTSQFVVYLLLSGMIHAGLILGLSAFQPARIEYRRGVSAVELNLMPSVPARKRKNTSPEIEQVPELPTLEELTEELGTDKPREDFYRREADFTEIPLPEKRQRKEPEPEDEPEEKESPEEYEDDVDAPDAPGDVREEGVTSGVERQSVPRPQYPRLARRRGHEGEVAVRVLVDPEGRPAEVKLMESSGYDSLDNAATEAAEKARFKPALRLGRPVDSEIILNFRFRLEDER